LRFFSLKRHIRKFQPRNYLLNALPCDIRVADEFLHSINIQANVLVEIIDDLAQNGNFVNVKDLFYKMSFDSCSNFKLYSHFKI
jgi:hypothetical protein